MTWIFDHFGLVVFVFVAFSFLRAMMRASRLSSEHKAQGDETEEQKRVREIQERIRRKVAERRGGGAGNSPPPPVLAEARGLLRPSPVPPLDPFGGPMRRLLVELERKAEAPPVASAAPTPGEAAILERQRRLGEQLRALEEARVLAQRRAAEVTAAATIEAESAMGVRTAAREALLADLSDPAGLRRAFLLREVLGAPVGLR